MNYFLYANEQKKTQKKLNKGTYQSQITKVCLAIFSFSVYNFLFLVKDVRREEKGEIGWHIK